MDKYKAKIQAFAWGIVALLSICLSAFWWLELQDTQADLNTLTVKFAKSIKENAAEVNAIEKKLVQSKCENHYLIGCLTGNPTHISLESLAQDLVNARELTIGLMHSTEVAQKQRQK